MQAPVPLLHNFFHGLRGKTGDLAKKRGLGLDQIAIIELVEKGLRSTRARRKDRARSLFSEVALSLLQGLLNQSGIAASS